MMGRTALPLYAKIVGWLALNAVLLVAALAMTLWFGFGIRPAAMLTADAAGQVGSVGRLLVSDLRRAPRDEWDEIVARYDEAYRVRFILLGPRGEQLVGTSTTLPAEIADRVRSEREERSERRAGDPGLGRDVVDARRPPRRGVTRIDGHYWSVQRLPAGGRPGGGPPPVWLVVRSDSLGAGGLFLDLRPWLAGVGLAAFLSVVWWFPFVRRITGSISAMEAATGRVARGNFDLIGKDADWQGRFARSLRRRDELGELARAIAAMARRLEGYVTGQRRFLGDIAHELCAPIARGQVAVEILAQRVGKPEQERVNDLREEVEEMSRLV
ncbi:MAG: HAMP domain-containing protein, partial [Chthoniobacterales bacterium]